MLLKTSHIFLKDMAGGKLVIEKSQHIVFRKFGAIANGMITDAHVHKDGRPLPRRPIPRS